MKILRQISWDCQNGFWFPTGKLVLLLGLRDLADYYENPDEFLLNLKDDNNIKQKCYSVGLRVKNWKEETLDRNPLWLDGRCWVELTLVPEGTEEIRGWKPDRESVEDYDYGIR